MERIFFLFLETSEIKFLNLFCRPIIERPIRGRGGLGRGRGGRGRGMGRGDGFDSRGKREFDRHSGSDRS